MKINEIFFSLQGEGILVGTPTIFIRLTGCNLRCSFCDTTYAYKDGTSMSISAIVKEIQKFHCFTVCITGGEPLLQKKTPILIDTLLKKKYLICLETNGSKTIKKLMGKISFSVLTWTKTNTKSSRLGPDAPAHSVIMLVCTAA